MSKNDTILLDGILDERVEIQLPSDRRDEVFEYFAFEQILQDYDLSQDEIDSGIVDGRNDGGIDGFYIFVNGHILVDPLDFAWPRSGAQIQVYILTCKHHDTFKQAPLDKLVATLNELFDLTVEHELLDGKYSAELLSCRENLRFAYRKLSPRLKDFRMTVIYASRGDTSQLGDALVKRGEQIQRLSQQCFAASISEFFFFGAAELVELNRRIPTYSLALRFYEVLSRGHGYIVLTGLKHFHNFVTADGKLRRYLFDSNVRDFMGLNRVNEDIKRSLDNEDSPDCWTLNNGITILTTGASVVGKEIHLEDIQIVNGLQTTESIYRYFSGGGCDDTERSVLVKIIVSKDPKVQDEIIRATNNQTNVELASLHATDKIQRDIEEILLKYELYYDRRKNYYKNLGYPSSAIISPLYLAWGYMALVLKSPFRAARMRSRFMRSGELYERIFSPKSPIEIWPAIAQIMLRCAESLERHRPKGGSQGFLKRWRPLVALIVVARRFGSFDFSVSDLIGVDWAGLEEAEYTEVVDFVMESVAQESSARRRRKQKYYLECCQSAANEFSINSVEVLERYQTLEWSEGPKVKIEVSEEFAGKVDDQLPPQPWKPGIHKEVIKKLGCTQKEYQAAVKLLIRDGKRNHQKNGVVYDDEGNVVCFDEERVDAQSLRLIRED